MRQVLVRAEVRLVNDSSATQNHYAISVSVEERLIEAEGPPVLSVIVKVDLTNPLMALKMRRCAGPATHVY